MTHRLVAIADTNWAAIDGQLAASLTTDPLDLPFDRFLNLIYSWATLDGEPDQVKRFDARLWIPPKGEAPAAQSPWSAEAETKAFKGFASALNPGATGASMRQGARTRDGG